MTQEENIHVPTIIPATQSPYRPKKGEKKEEKKENINVPTIIQQDRVEVPMILEEVVHVPKIIQQENIIQQHVETMVEVVHVPKIIQQEIVHWALAPFDEQVAQAPVIVQCSPPVDELFFATALGPSAPSAPKRRNSQITFTGVALLVKCEETRLATLW
jgi:hypothetical protein